MNVGDTNTVVEIISEEESNTCQEAETAEAEAFDSSEEAETEARRDAEKAYLTRLSTFNQSYIRLVIAVFIGVLGGIAVAIHMNLWLGIAVAVFSATAYAYFSSSDCRRLMGIVYKNENGRITVEQAVVRHGNSIIIPDRLIFADVTSLSDGALVASRNAKLSRVYIPKSIKQIGERILGGDGKTVTFLYEGSPEEWEAIEKRSELSGCTVIFNVAYPRLPKKQKGKAKSPSRGKGEKK